MAQIMKKMDSWSRGLRPGAEPQPQPWPGRWAAPGNPTIN